VLAPATGTVVEVVDGVPDSPVGKPNLEENWGNLVILQHGLGLFSMVCHLRPGSIPVEQGQTVRRGQQIGRCGSSGRADVPHVHLQLQGTGRIGAPTIAMELHDVVLARPDEPERLVPTADVQQGDEVRNLESDPLVARLFELPFGVAQRWQVDGRQEVLVPDIDLYGRLLLRSEDAAATLFYEHAAGLFTVYDVIGTRPSVLHLMYAALARVPLEEGDDVEWQDELLRVHARGTLAQVAFDFVAPFAPRAALRVRYRRRHEGRALVVEGASLEQDAAGAPRLSSLARLEPDVGLVRVEVTHRGRTRTAVRIRSTPQEASP